MSFVRLYSRDLDYNSLVLIFLEIAEEPPGHSALERRLTNNRHFPLPYHSMFTLSLGAFGCAIPRAQICGFRF